MTTASAVVRPGPATYTPSGMMRRLSRAALVIFDEVIWKATQFGAIAERLTDRFIAAETGYAIRTVQAAVHDLCNAVAAVVDGREVMLLERSRRYGPREECGRELRVTAPQVVPVKKEEDRPPAPKGKARGKPAGSPDPALAQASAAVAKAAEVLKAEPTPEDAEEARRIAEELHKKIHREMPRIDAKIARVERRQGKVIIDPQELEPDAPRGFIDPAGPEPHKRE